MRGLLIGLVVTATTALAPMLAIAGNQETAERIAANLRNSGQLHAYKIGVKYQDGTAWLRGLVTSQAQMQTALRIAAQTPGVDRVENEMSIRPGKSAAAAAPKSALGPVQPATADLPAQPLKQVAGAVAPEQYPRALSPSLRTTRSPVVAQTRQMSSGQAQRPASSFARMPVRQVGAQEPTLAPQRQASQPTLAPQPALGQTAAQQVALQRAVPQQYAPQQMAPRPIAARAAVPAAAPRPIPVAYAQGNGPVPAMPEAPNGAPAPAYATPVQGSPAPARYDQAYMPNYAWPSYAAYPNYAALTYPKQYSPTAWPYIGPFYPYPQVPLGWRKVTLQWHDGWWMLDFDDGATAQPLSGLFRAK